MQTLPTRTRVVLGALSLVCVLGTNTRAQADTYDTLERLLPAQTVGVLSLPSVERVQTILERWYVEFQGDPDGASHETPNVREEIAKLVGVDAAHIDTKRPVVAALSLAVAGSPPMPSVLLPVRDEDTVLEAMEGNASSQFSATHPTGRGYIVLTAAPHYAPDAGTFALGAPREPSDVRLALDLATLYQTYGPMLEFLMASLAQQMQEGATDPGTLEAVSRAAEWAQSVLGNAERFEITLSAARKPLRLSSTLRSRPGSPPVVPVHDAERTLALTRVLDPQATALGTIAADLRHFYDWSMSAQRGQIDRELESVAPDQSDALQALMEQSSELQRLLTGPNAYALDFGEQGVEVVHLMQLEHPETFLGTFRETMISMEALEPLGFVVREQASTRLEGTEVSVWNLSFNPDFVTLRPRQGHSPLRDFQDMQRRLFGGDAAVVRLAIVEDIAVLVLHREDKRMRETLKRLKKKSGEAPQRLRSLAARHAGTPWLLFDGDLRGVVAGFVDAILQPDASGDPDAYRDLMRGAPVPVTVSSAQRDGVLHCEMTAEVRGLADLFESLRRILPERKEPPASGG